MGPLAAALLLSRLAVGPAAAFPGVPGEFPRGLDFDLVETGVPQQDRLVVMRGGVKAPVLGLPLFNRYTSHVDVSPSQNLSRIVIRYEREAGTVTVTRPLEDFEALLANAEGLRSQRQKDYPQAADGFSRALSLHGQFPEAAVNLACAYAMLGQTDRALKAVRPLLQSRPIMLYRKIAADPELAALRGEPEVKGLKAPKPGSARWNAKTGAFEGGLVAYSASRDAVAAAAAVRQYSESEEPDRLHYRLRFFEPSSSLPLDEWPLDGVSEAQVDRVLADLGFDVPEQETARSKAKGSEPEPLTLPRSGWTLELVAKQANAGPRVRLSGRSGERQAGLPADPYLEVTPERLDSAAYVPSLRAAVAFWGYFAGEGGGDWAYTAPVVVPLR